jgi:hypothetical protein
MARNLLEQDMEKWVAKTILKTEAVAKIVINEVFSRVVDKTPINADPVEHRGYTKANWQIGLNEDGTSEINARDPNGEQTKKRELSKVMSAPLQPVYYIYNNFGAANMLEYGLYSKSSTTGKTSGGFSVQAPYGMVRITLAEFGTIVDQAITSVDGGL